MTMGTDSEASVGIEMTTSRLERERREKEEYSKLIADPITRSIGEIGKWQISMCILIFLMKFPVGWHQLATVFLAPEIYFKCDENNNFTNKCMEECENTNATYDTSIFTNTIIMQFNLICDRQYLANLSQTIFMFGILVGNVFFGLLADKYGRRLPLVISCIMQLVTGTLTSFTTNYWLFCLLRFLLAVATGGSMLTSFCLVVELIGPKYRELLSVLYQIPFNIGHASLAIFSYFLRDWRWLQFAISIPSILFISYYWLLPESPRWLLAENRLDEATDILEKAAEFNNLNGNKVRPNIEEYMKQKVVSDTKKGNICDLFLYRNLRLKTICISYNWMVCGLTFFGVSQYIGNIGGDIFTNVAVSASLGLPGTLICIPLIKYWGRKNTLMASQSLAGLSMLAIALFPDESKYHIIKIILSSFGLFAMTISFPNIYVYSGEIYPTVVRNAGMGISSMFARFGAMAAPFVSSASSYAYFIPPVVFGTIPVIGAALVLLLPETKDQPLPDTIEDGELFGKKEKIIERT